MKITKRQLRRIIKEEKAKLIAEAKVRRLVRHKLRENASGQLYFSASPGGGGRIFRLGQDEPLYTYSWSEDVLYEDPNSNVQERAETFQKMKQAIEQYGDVLNGATYDEGLDDGWAGADTTVSEFVFMGLTNGDGPPMEAWSGKPWASSLHWPAVEQWVMTTKLEW